MADVFLSYARGDRAVAERLAHAIGETGLTVWWDRHIKGGAEFSRDIEQQLETASRVLVLWSKEAVNSRWVRDEASVAADSQRLVSTTIDGTPPPLGFRQFQTINLKRWAAKGARIPLELAEALDIEAPAPGAAASPGSPKRRLVAAAAGALLLAGAATVAIVRPPPFDQLFAGERHSEGLALAIMPFVTEGAGIEYLGAGLASALADSLAPLSGLKITASTSTQAIAGQKLTAPEIAERLGVTHLVEGNVHKAADRYSISIRLVGAKGSEQVWARTFEGKADELQALKTRMARELAGALNARLGIGQGEVVDRGTVDPMAYEAYLRALERVSVRDEREARVEAIKQFRLAGSIQPDFADAHAGHAYLLGLSLPRQLGMSLEQLLAEQRRATARALELDPDNEMALIAKATALKNFGGDAEQALAIDKAVLQRSPNFTPAHYSMAASLWMLGEPRQAIHHLDQAIDLDPFDNLLRFYRIRVLYTVGDYEAVRDAVRQCPPPCAGAGWFWFLALAGFGTPVQHKEDQTLLNERAATERLSPAELAEARGLTEALQLNRPFTLSPLEDERNLHFVDAALEARLGNISSAFRYATIALNDQHADDVLDILNDGRVTFTAEQRADPRYHALFRHPKLAKIEAARRKRGVTAGLPVFPMKPYSGR